MDTFVEVIPQQQIEVGGYLYHVKRLHEVPNLIDQCCDFINKEWKRSNTARLRSIEGSSEKFPMSVLLLKGTKKPEVVGHCKISRLSMSNTKVFVETVLIHPNLRGKGLGKFLMNEVEYICKSKSIKQIYLSTKGQEGFYRKLGYAQCSPVGLYGCQFNKSDEDVSEEEVNAVSNAVSNNLANVPAPPPPPPPPKMPLKMELNNLFTGVSSVFKFDVVEDV